MAGGIVRRTPTAARLMMSAAAMPVTKEIWAFHFSTSVRARKASL
jgi:hypothetical protein